jgi:hypothetical protein
MSRRRRRTLPDDRPRCHHCKGIATHQWQRKATTAEATAHWDAVELNIRAANSGRPDVDYQADRTDTVTVPVHGCADHNLNPAPAPANDTPEAHAAARAAAEQAGADARACLHDAECRGHNTCGCALEPPQQDFFE